MRAGVDYLRLAHKWLHFIYSILARIIHHTRNASLVIRMYNTFASLTNTGSIRSLAENAVNSNSYAIRSLSDELCGVGGLSHFLNREILKVVIFTGCAVPLERHRVDLA